MLLAVACGGLAVAGHVWPIFLRFKGGKGVATMAGVLFAMNWMAALIVLGVWVLALLIGRYVSLASMVAAVSMPISSNFTGGLVEKQWNSPSWIVTVFFALAGVLVIVRHRENIRRLRDKEETRVRFRRARGAGGTT